MVGSGVRADWCRVKIVGEGRINAQAGQWRVETPERGTKERIDRSSRTGIGEQRAYKSLTSSGSRERVRIAIFFVRGEILYISLRGGVDQPK